MSEEIVTQQAEETKVSPEAPNAEGTEQSAADSNQEPKEGDEERKKESGFQKRINRLTREKYELAGRLKALEEQASKAAPKPQDDKEPKLEDYGDDTVKFLKDLNAWQYKQLHKSQDETKPKQQEADNGPDLVQAWKKNVKQFAKENPDAWAEVQAADVETSPAMERVLMESDMGPQIAHYLATHPDEADDLLDMSPTAVARAIGRIEAKLEQAPQKKPSNAPRPPSPVGQRGVPVTKDPSNMSFDEFKAWREKSTK